ncbi:MAG: hypothetical protein ACKVQT_14465 [Burkholderiales bacterium]
MDIFSHSLWVIAGVEVARRRRIITGRHYFIPSAILAALPDVIHLVPVLAWALFGNGSIAGLYSYAIALPDREPAMPAMVALTAHHLHCIMHSGIVAGALTALVWLVHRRLWPPLLAWWSHILIDVFTHSDDYYPSPIFYPITYWGFDGLAWNKPALLAINYALLIVMFFWLHLARTRKRPR